jgi:ammonium transporter, Amt family
MAVTGAFAERMSWPAFVGLLLGFEAFVYFPVAHWMWNPAGWLALHGVLDFAGGIVLHTTAGVGALVVSSARGNASRENGCALLID